MMPDVSIRIGERLFKVTCQDGEEGALNQAAGLLNAEAKTLEGQSRRLPEAQMLLMAGLMLADKHVAAAGNKRQLEETVARQEARIKDLEGQVAQGRMQAAPPGDKVSEALARGAERADALAELAEKRSGAHA
ncbi:MAG: cell division protein ZapA [Boseongicola sp. SB0676_bin_33]|nr:cell division protein ZapA [Boseongicola sp. SB0676_bin_33]